MKAIVMTEPGGVDRLKMMDFPDPDAPKPGHILVHLAAAGVNPIDTKIRTRGPFYPDALPCILGCDGAGEVVAVGQGSNYQPGDRVWYFHGGIGQAPGNYAEYHELPQTIARPMPDSLSGIQAAAGPLVIITAWEALYDRARLVSGQTLFIPGGAGGVGHIAIQLAKQRGARVITSVSNESKADFVRQLGADEIIRYDQQDPVERVMDLTRGRGADVVFDTLGGDVFDQCIQCTAHYGDLVTLLDPGTRPLKEARNRNIRISFTFILIPMLRNLPEALAHQGAILDQCAQWIDQGRLKIHVSHQLPLAQAADAHRLIEQGHTQGKIVLLPPIRPPG
jgi:NADPH2:quinone reductase